MPLDRNQLYKLSVHQFRRMLELNILGESRGVELLEGLLFDRVLHPSADSRTVQKFEAALRERLPSSCEVICSALLCLQHCEPESEPRPDFVVRASSAAVIVVAIASACPTIERVDLGRIYARARISNYWVLDYAAATVEVYAHPSGPIDSPHYAKRDRYPVGTGVPVVLDSVTVGTIAVADLMG